MEAKASIQNTKETTMDTLKADMEEAKVVMVVDPEVDTTASLSIKMITVEAVVTVTGGIEQVARVEVMEDILLLTLLIQIRAQTLRILLLIQALLNQHPIHIMEVEALNFSPHFNQLTTTEVGGLHQTRFSLTIWPSTLTRTT
jgi:hypothetical protein